MAGSAHDSVLVRFMPLTGRRSAGLCVADPAVLHRLPDVGLGLGLVPMLLPRRLEAHRAPLVR